MTVTVNLNRLSTGPPLVLDHLDHGDERVDEVVPEEEEEEDEDAAPKSTQVVGWRWLMRLW